MPEIKDYGLSPDVNSQLEGRRQSPHETDPAAGYNAIAQGIEGLANAGVKGYQVYQKHQEDKDISNAQAALSKARVDMSKTLLNDLNAPGAADQKDFSDKFAQKYDDYVAQNVEPLITSDAAQKYYTRANASLKAELQIHAFTAQAHLAGEKQKDNMTSMISNGGNTLEAFPSQFTGVVKDFNDAVDHQAGLNDAQRQELKTKGAQQFAYSMGRGWINQGEPGRQTLEKMINSGDLNGYLPPHGVDDLRGHIAQGRRADEAELERQRREAERLKNERAEVINQQLFSKYADKSLTVKDVTSTPNDFPEHFKMQWVKQIKADATSGWHSDKNTVSDILRRMDLPPGDPQRIASQDQIMKYVGTNTTGNINMTDAVKLTHYYEKGTPQREADARAWADYRRQVFNGIAKPDPVTKIPATPELGERANQVVTQLRDLELKDRVNGIPAAQALDPHNPNYAGKRVPVSPTSMDEHTDSFLRHIFQNNNNSAAPATPERKLDPQGVLREKDPKSGKWLKVGK